MKVVVFGKGERAVKCLEAMVAAGFPPVAVLAEGGDDAVTAAAERLGVSRIAGEGDVAGLAPDLLVLISYTKILKEPLVSTPRFGTINVHGGKLPDYRGASVLNWQIIQGEREGGVAILQVDEGIDTGPILAEARYPIAPTDTFKEVSAKTIKISPRLLIEVLRGLEAGTLTPRPQPSGGAYWHKRRPEDGRIQWQTMSAVDVHNLVRALAKPCPGAYTFLDGKKVILWRTDLLEETFRGIPGRLVRPFRNGIVVVARDRGLLVLDCEVEGMDEGAGREFLSQRLGATFTGA